MTGRHLLRRLEKPIPFYEQRIVNNLGVNFEIIKYNIVGLGAFDYQSIWAEKRL
jgi:hypothetical protein